MTAERPEPRRPGEPLSLTLITGFLGSGKTTLLNRLLRDPALADTAVIINEFGEIGLDHLLVEKVEDATRPAPSQTASVSSGVTTSSSSFPGPTPADSTPQTPPPKPKPPTVKTRIGLVSNNFPAGSQCFGLPNEATMLVSLPGARKTRPVEACASAFTSELGTAFSASLESGCCRGSVTGNAGREAQLSLTRTCVAKKERESGRDDNCMRERPCAADCKGR